MPTIWVAPALYLEHNGVKVFHTYVDDDVGQGVNDVFFTTDPSCDEGNKFVFDARTLAVPSVALLEQHPPYLREDNPVYANGSPAERAQWQKDWKRWHDEGFPAAIKAIIKEAIEMGLIEVPDPEPSELELQFVVAVPASYVVEKGNVLDVIVSALQARDIPAAVTPLN